MDIYELLACAETEGQLNFLKTKIRRLLRKESKDSKKYKSIHYAYRMASERIRAIPWKFRGIQWYDEVCPEIQTNNGYANIKRAF